MGMFKYINILLIFMLSLFIGRQISKKYKLRKEELEEIKVALNLFKTKLKFTQDTLQEIFWDLEDRLTSNNIKNIFLHITKKMDCMTAEEAWETSIEEGSSNINKEDKKVIKTLGKLLGQLDLEGQVARIEITEELLDRQIKEAICQKEKNEKLYRTTSEQY